jgi:hypothetical protein
MSRASPNYVANKEKLAQCISEVKTDKQIAELLNIGVSTAGRWKKRYYSEEGHINDEKAKEISNKYIVDKQNDFDLQRKVLLQIMVSKESGPNTRINASNALIALAKAEADILNRFKIIDSEKTEVNLSGKLDIDTLSKKIEAEMD